MPDPVLPDCSLDNPPKADFSFTPADGKDAREGRDVAFADRSTDPENDIVKLQWDFGDGATATGAAPHHLFDENGAYHVKLTATDAKGNTDTVTHDVVVLNELPEADIDDADGTPDRVEFTYRMLDPGKTDKRDLAYRISSPKAGWPAQSSRQPAGVYSRSITGLPAGVYPVTLTVTDKDGGEATDDATITVRGPEATPTPTPTSTPSPSFATCDANVSLDGEERELLDLINEYREDNHLPDVALSATLTKGAERHAHDMAVHDFMAHTGSDGSSPADRAWGAGYPKTAGVGENLAESETAKDSLWAWRGSLTGHNENMLNPGWRAIGIARERSASGQWRTATSYGTVLDCAATDPAKRRLSSADPTPPGAGAAPQQLPALTADAPSGDDAAPVAQLAPVSALPAATPAADAEPIARHYAPTVALTLAADRPKATRPVAATNRTREPDGTPLKASFDFGDGAGPVALDPDASVDVRYPASAYSEWYDIAGSATSAHGPDASLERSIRVYPMSAPYLWALDNAEDAIAGRPYTVGYRVYDRDSGDPLSGLELTFTLGDQVVHATTDDNGDASAQLVMLDQPAGWQRVHVEFAGTDDYKPAAADKDIYVRVNHAPKADAGGPYVIGEGSDLLLNGARSSDEDPINWDHITRYQWDLDGDGAYDDLEGRLPSPLTSDDVDQRVCGGTCVAGQSYPIGLRVTDAHGGIGTQATTVRVTADFDVTLGGESKTIVPGASANFGVTVIGSKSYSKPVTLSVKDLPAGVTATWSRNPITPSGVTNLTLTADSSVDAGGFALHIVATDGDITKEVSDDMSVGFGLIPICYGTITGTVTDRTTGKPVAGVLVDRYGTDGTVTDANGRYVMDKVALGFNNAPITTGVRAGKDRYWDATSADGEVTCGGLTQLDVTILAKQKGVITGKVVDKATQKPLGGADITDYLGHVASTGDDGTFSAEHDLNSDNRDLPLSLTAQKTGYWSAGKQVTVSSSGPADGQFELVKQCSGLIKGGQVLWDGTNEPVEGASVTLSGVSGFGVTGADGRFTIGTTALLSYNNAEAWYGFTVRPPSDAPAGTGGTSGYFKLTECGAEAEVTAYLHKPKPSKAALHGTVTDKESGEPLPGLYVSTCTYGSFGCESDITDANGAYRLDPVNLGFDGASAWKTIVVSPAGYYAASGSQYLQEGDDKELNLKVLKRRFGALHVNVTDSVTGAPIPNAYVSDGCQAVCDSADRNGELTRANLTLGDANSDINRSPTATANGYWSQSKTITLKAGETTQVDYKLQPECAPAEIRGTVVNAQTQAPIQGALIQESSGLSVSTDAQGKFTIANVKPASGNNPRQVYLTASAEGFFSQQKLVTIFCGARINVDFGSQTSKTGTITGTVIDATSGQPLKDAFVGSTFGATAQTDDQGHYRLEGAPLNNGNTPREWQVNVAPAGYKAKTQSITVGPDVEAVLNFAFSGDNAAPAAQAQTVTLDEDTDKDITLGGSDPDGDALTYHVMSWPQHGELRRQNDGSYNYDPDPNYNGHDAFEFVVDDTVATSPRAKVDIDVAPVNDPPVANSDQLEAEADETTRFPASALLANDTDADGEPLHISRVETNSDATVSLEGDQVVFTPPPGVTTANPYAFFIYWVKDPSGTESSYAFAYIKVSRSPKAPVCQGSHLQTPRDQALTGAVACADANGDALTYALVDGPDQGALDLHADGTFTYTPPAGWTGSTHFTYRANDGALDSATTRVDIAVRGENRAPACADRTIDATEDTAVEFTLSCADADADPLAYAVQAGGLAGTLEALGGGHYRYTPAPDWHGTDTAPFTANDGMTDSAAAALRIVVAPVNDLPVCRDVAIAADDAGGATDPDCTDADGDALRYEIAGAAGHGTATVENGRLRYRTASDGSADDAFTYVARDGDGAGAPARAAVTITRTPVPTSTPTPEPTATSTPTPEPTATSTPTPEPTTTSTPTPGPTTTSTPTPEPTTTSTPTPGPTTTSTPTPGPTTTSTPTPEPTTTATVTPEPTESATPSPTPDHEVEHEHSSGNQLLRCAHGPVVLTDVLPVGRRVVLNGLARSKYAGRRVTIALLHGRTVARPKVGRDGRFHATAPLPRVKGSDRDLVRYYATLGGHRSLALKLWRRLLVKSVHAAGGKITVTGRLVGPLPRRRADRTIVVRHQSDCHDGKVVARAMPRADGSFRLVLRRERGKPGAVYRLKAHVRRQAPSHGLALTYSLPLAVDF